MGPQGRLVIGEAGVGKSTLVRQLLPEVRLRGAALVTGRALESESRPPYGPWAEVVLGLHEMGLVPSRPWPLLERLVPALRGHSSMRRRHRHSTSAHGHRLLQELVTFLRATSEARPLILVLEDMHWADTASWDALEYVLSQLSTERVFIALTLRSEEATYGVVRERRRRLSRDERVRELHLERLTASEVREWLQAALHRTELGDDLLEFVLRHTEGNPFLVMQLLRTMVEENVFTYSGSAWVLDDPGDARAARRACPISWAGGSRGCRTTRMRVLVTAAAIGRTFRLDLLAAAAGVSMEAVLDAVDSGLATSVLEPAHEQDDDTYQFSHALLMEAMMRSVSPARQRLIHRRIADLLAARTPARGRSGGVALRAQWRRGAGLYLVPQRRRARDVAVRPGRSDGLPEARARARHHRGAAGGGVRRAGDARPSCRGGGPTSSGGATRCWRRPAWPTSSRARFQPSSGGSRRACGSAWGRGRRSSSAARCWRWPSGSAAAPTSCRSGRCSCRR